MRLGAVRRIQLDEVLHVEPGPAEEPEQFAVRLREMAERAHNRPADVSVTAAAANGDSELEARWTRIIERSGADYPWSVVERQAREAGADDAILKRLQLHHIGARRLVAAAPAGVPTPVVSAEPGADAKCHLCPSLTFYSTAHLARHYRHDHYDYQRADAIERRHEHEPGRRPRPRTEAQRPHPHRIIRA